MRWSLRFWPDTRSMVDDVIGFAGSNHGSVPQRQLNAIGCRPTCPPADWQQAAGSQFLQALNSRAETFPGVSYTEIYTHTDEVVQPAGDDTGSSSLHGGGGQITNIATQDICPADPWEHIGVGTIDPVAYALALDALTHPGPADPARIPRSVCSQAHMPGVDPLSAERNLAALAAVPGLLPILVGNANIVSAPQAPSEPPLACYVYADCRMPPTTCKITKRVTFQLPRGARHLRATVDGHRVRVLRHGRRATVRVTITTTPARRVTIRLTAARRAGTRFALARVLTTPACATQGSGR